MLKTHTVETGTTRPVITKRVSDAVGDQGRVWKGFPRRGRQIWELRDEQKPEIHSRKEPGVPWLRRASSRPDLARDLPKGRQHGRSRGTARPCVHLRKCLTTRSLQLQGDEPETPIFPLDSSALDFPGSSFSCPGSEDYGRCCHRRVFCDVIRRSMGCV